MRWVRRGVVGQLVLAVLVPVLAGAIAGLSPRHWSGTRLVAVQLPGVIASTPPPHAEGRTYTESELRSLRDGLTFPRVNLPEGGFMIYTDAHRRQVIVTTTALTHGGFAFSADRYGDAVALTWEPFAGVSSLDPEHAPSAWSQTRPLTSWLTLATGFPWYLAAGVLVAVGGWLLVRWLRGKRPAAAAIPAETPTQG